MNAIVCARVCVFVFFYSSLLTTAFLTHLCFVRVSFLFRRHEFDGPSIVLESKIGHNKSLNAHNATFRNCNSI